MAVEAHIKLSGLIRRAVDPLSEDAVAYTPEGVAIAVLDALKKNQPVVEDYLEELARAEKR